jgi:curved DNA-binding protein CbpA
MDGGRARRDHSDVDLYEVLLVSRNADVEVIRAAYRVLARRHHPDVGGDQRRMTAINEAWAVLGDPIGRRRYDATLRQEQVRAAVSVANRPSAAAATAAAAASARPAPGAGVRPAGATAGATAGAAETGSSSSAPPFAGYRPDRPPTPPAGPGVIDFGRYAGWSVQDLGRHDPDYLLWLERTPVGRSLRGEIQRVLELQRGAAAAIATRQPAATDRRHGGRWFR